MAVITVFTVGYGDLTPHTMAGQKIVMAMLVTGVGYISFFSSMLTTCLIEGQVIQILGGRVMEKKIAKLRNHVIVCGLGRTGSSAIRQLINNKKPFVGIDVDEDKCMALREGGYLSMVGDATEDTMLEKLGVRYASGIIVALPDDADNMLVTMAARDLNKNIRIVTRANRKENETRLARAGADWVIPVGFTGGSHLAMAAIRPATISFMQKILDWNDMDLKLEEFLIEPSCSLVNKPIKETGIRERYGVQVLAIQRGERLIPNPSPEEVLLTGDVIITFGTSQRMEEMITCLGVSCPVHSLKVPGNKF
ncbi:potassium channel family protein [Desulfotomaculum nigrificans]|uniref:potassium channel family protein n=1 Tax=Desulfotomaculum nigrificans TaxID=1565 RepID=UPI003BEF2276